MSLLLSHSCGYFVWSSHRTPLVLGRYPAAAGLGGFVLLPLRSDDGGASTARTQRPSGSDDGASTVPSAEASRFTIQSWRVVLVSAFKVNGWLPGASDLRVRAFPFLDLGSVMPIVLPRFVQI